MTENNENNVIPIKPKVRFDKFRVYLAEIDEGGQVVEKDQVGLAFLKEKSKTFRLKLWILSSSLYFLVPAKGDNTKYTIYSVEEFNFQKNERSFWNKIGDAELFGNYLRLQIPIFGAELFMSLFPEETLSSKARSA